MNMYFIHLAFFNHLFFEQGKVEEVTSLSISLLEMFWNVKFWPGSLD